METSLNRLIALFEMYRYIKSLYCVTGTNICCRSIILQKQANEFIEKEIRFMVTRDSEWGRRNWMKAVKRYKLLVIG